MPINPGIDVTGQQRSSAQTTRSMPGRPFRVIGFGEWLGDFAGALDESLDDRAQGAVL